MRQNELLERDVRRKETREKSLKTIKHLKMKKVWIVRQLYGVALLINWWVWFIGLRGGAAKVRTGKGEEERH